MAKRILIVVAALFIASCSYETGFDVTCDDEGEVVDGRRCEGGFWVNDDTRAMDMGDDTSNVNNVNNVNNSNNASNNMSDMGDDMEQDMCAPESDAEFCARLVLNCGEVTAEDNCGDMRTVPSCGMCTMPATCGGGGTDNVCACGDQTDVEFCADNAATCGGVTNTDKCGLERTVNCGMCDTMPQTCGGAGTANTCGCGDDAAVCAEYGYECGEVNIDGLCARGGNASCGACDPNGTCSNNQCDCDAGWTGNGLTCTDIDECATNVDNCHPDAVCTNNDGGFSCACRAGYTGDGVVDCSPNTIVTSIEHVTITLTGTSGSANLTTTVSNAIPFATKSLSNVDDEPRDFTVELSLNGAGDQVIATRDQSSGTITIEVTVVAFDPTRVRVQTGSFSMGNPNSSDTVNIPMALGSRDSAFSVFSFSATSSSDSHSVSSIRADILSTNQIIFERQSSSGSINGTWYIAEALNNEFSVQHVLMTGFGGFSDTEMIQSVDLTKTVVLYSYEGATNNVQSSYVKCDLDNTTTVECDRSSDFSSSGDITVQVVEFGGTERVQAGTLSTNNSSTTDTLGRSVTPADSLLLSGAQGTFGACRASSNSVNPGYGRLTFDNNGAGVRLDRGSDFGGIRCSYQVLEP